MGRLRYAYSLALIAVCAALLQCAGESDASEDCEFHGRDCAADCCDATSLLHGGFA